MRNMQLYIIALLLITITLMGCSKQDEYAPAVSIECNESTVIGNYHQIEGYTDKVSYSVGDTIFFKVHTLTNKFNIRIYRYGATTVLVHSKDSIDGVRQDYPCRSDSIGCSWKTSYEYIIPAGLSSGIYAATLTNSLAETFEISFVLKGSATNNDILVLANSNTWQAYNNWNGQSFYQHNISGPKPNSTILSFHRPNIRDEPIGNDGHLVNAELHLHKWLENRGYNFDVIADTDLHNNSQVLNNYKVLILNVHPEYWTSEMYNGLINYLTNGGNLMYLGGNGIYRRVALANDKIEVIWNGGTHSFTQGLGGKWRDLGMPESSILGVEYTLAGYNTYSPYSVSNPNHWIFNNTGVTNGQLIGENSLNNGKASGHETDKTTIHSPANLVLLATGVNPAGGGAQMVYYENQNGSKVFSVGSITYTGSLSVDPIIDQLTQNVLNNFIQ